MDTENYKTLYMPKLFCIGGGYYIESEGEEELSEDD